MHLPHEAIFKEYQNRSGVRGRAWERRERGCSSFHSFHIHNTKTIGKNTADFHWSLLFTTLLHCKLFSFEDLSYGCCSNVISVVVVVVVIIVINIVVVRLHLVVVGSPLVTFALWPFAYYLYTRSLSLAQIAPYRCCYHYAVRFLPTSNYRGQWSVFCDSILLDFITVALLLLLDYALISVFICHLQRMFTNRRAIE